LDPLDVSQRLAPLGDAFRAHAYAMVALHVALLAGLVCLARHELSANWRGAGRRFRIALVGAALLSVVVSGLVIPAFERHGWDGHESFYLDLFVGQENAEMKTAAWTRLTSAPLRLLYLALAAIPGMPPGAMVVMSLLFGAATVVVVGWTARELSGDPLAGGIAAALVALHPHQACWNSSAYHVVLPQLAAAAALLTLVWAARASSATLFALFAALWTFAVGARIEYLLLAPAFAAVTVLLMPRLLESWRSWSVGLGLAALLAALHILRLSGIVAQQSSGASGTARLEYLPQHLWWPDVWHPYDTPWTWAALIAGSIAFGRASTRRALLALLAVIAIFHTGYACFDDYSTRHSLLAVALVGCVAAVGIAAARHWHRLGWIVAVALGLLCAIPCAGTLARFRTAYYADREPLYASAGEDVWATRLDLESYADCYLITEWERLHEELGPQRAGSHFNLLDPSARPGLLTRHDGCVLWLYDMDNANWSSRDVHMRAAKMRWLFDWELMGAIRLEDGYEALVYRWTQ